MNKDVTVYLTTWVQSAPLLKRCVPAGAHLCQLQLRTRAPPHLQHFSGFFFSDLFASFCARLTIYFHFTFQYQATRLGKPLWQGQITSVLTKSHPPSAVEW
jgi:hypothetical protein